MLQTTFEGTNSPLYGDQNAFIAKLTPDGFQLVFAAYIGKSQLNRDMAVDASGNIFVAGQADAVDPFNPSWFSNGFQQTIRGTNDCVVLKVSTDGTQVLGATYFGGAGLESGTPSIRLDCRRHPYLLSFTSSADLPVTSGAADTSFAGGRDMFVVKFSPDLSQRTWATYIGGSGTEFTETHGLAVDPPGRRGRRLHHQFDRPADHDRRVPADLRRLGRLRHWRGNELSQRWAPTSRSPPTAASSWAAPISAAAMAKASKAWPWMAQGNVYVSGSTFSNNFPVTADGFQRTLGGKADLFAVKLSSDLTQQLYGTYLGGSGDDYGRTAWADARATSTSAA